MTDPAFLPIFTESPQEVGRLLRRLRRLQKLSQSDISAILHISRQSYGAYERGERPVPREYWKPLAQLLPLPRNELLEAGDIFIARTQTEKELLKDFRRLDAEGRQQVLTLLAYELTWV